MNTPAAVPPPPWLDVWLEAGREGRSFTYGNPQGLLLGAGDLVQVRLVSTGDGRMHPVVKAVWREGVRVA